VRHYDNLPFVGQRGLEQQRIWKTQQITDREFEENKLEPIERMIQEVQRDARTQFEMPLTLYQQLSEVAQLGSLESRLRCNFDQLNGIDRDEFDKLEQRCSSLRAELESWENEQRALLQSQKGKDLARGEKELEATISAEKVAKEEFLRISGEYDYSQCLSRTEILRSETITLFPTLDVAARRFITRASEDSNNANVKIAEVIGARELFVNQFRK
jgi:hypothetical protein